MKRACYIGKANFPKGINCCEDLIWCILVLKCKPKISYLGKAYYHYMITTTDSQSKSISAERSLQDLKMLHMLESLLCDNKAVLIAMYKRIVPYVMKRAMKTNSFDSSYFKNNFRRYSKWIITSSNHSLILRLVCLSAANGFYYCCKPLVYLMN